jgi:hypothetical protein
LVTAVGGNWRITLLTVPGISPGPGEIEKSIVSLTGVPGLAFAGLILPPISEVGLSAAAGAAAIMRATAAAAVAARAARLVDICRL